MTRRKPITSLGAAAVVPLAALAVAGCGGGNDATGSTTAPHKPQPRPAARAAPKPRPRPAAPAAPKPQARPAAPPAAKPQPKNNIPQNGGGDGDADNNGGPDDGDGGV
jgi:hypothetical protein